MFEPYYQELQAFLARKTGDHDMAADIVQESYARVLTMHRSGELVTEPRALLYRVARNLLVDSVRQASFRDLESFEEISESGDEDLLPAVEAEAPDSQYAAVQYAMHMGEVIDGLPPRCREAFLMNRFEGLSHEEIARSMGISRNMVSQHIMRALDVCRACDQRIRE